MQLYHGTTLCNAENIINNGIDLLNSHIRTDFGRGFYTTPDRENAKKWAIKKSILEKPALVYITFDEKAARSIIKSFPVADIKWAQFIVNNRSGSEYINHFSGFLTDNNIDARYDIVCGQICDGQASKIVHRIASELRLADENDLLAMIAKEYPLQYSFHTKRAFSFIKSMRIVRL